PCDDVNRTFPAPSALAATKLERIAELGIILSRAGAIQAIAQAWSEIAVLLAPGARPEPLIERLCALPGIGPWTAHYVAMRALGWPDAFPPNDVAVLKALARWRATTTTTQREAEAHAQAWQPWRAYAVLRLWNSLEKTTP
ncbi:MAG TPA: adenosine deaminase, partial [Burkholderiaceae bacterium]|nr:adenosine deaminase [Burkholderiaceae bacterium]